VVATAQGCGVSRDSAVTVPWSVEWQGERVDCGKPSSLLNIEDLRFFVHDVRFVDEQGRETAARIVPDGRWQTDDVALIDFACGGERATHTSLNLRTNPGPFIALRFRLGVPFEQNHANAALAVGPLAIGAMNWSWQGGYKFLKLDGRLNDTPFRLHVGSTECAGTFAHITSCARPNLADITVPISTSGGVAVDLTPLLSTEAPASHCEGEAAASCQRPFEALGLGLANGLAAGGQHVFRAR
jgi:uncharacterized repeat protein (TIGR04052 family)